MVLPLSGLPFPTITAADILSRSRPTRGARRGIINLRPQVIDPRQALNQAQVTAGRQQIIRIALRRLDGIRQNIIQPEEGWETTAGFLTLTGQPFRLRVDDNGQVRADAQSTSALPEYNPGQQRQILAAADRARDLVQQADAIENKETFRNELLFAALRITQLDTFFPAKDRWEQDYLNYKRSGLPFRIQLNSEGELVAVNQLTTDFAEREPADRAALIAARTELRGVLNGTVTATKLWHFEALGRRSSKDDYFLDLDENRQPVIRTHTPTTIVPDILQPSDDDVIETDAPWEEDFLALYADRKPYFFDFDNNGRTLVVRENDFISVSDLRNPLANRLRGANAILSLLA